jgi:hypothetical protein
MQNTKHKHCEVITAWAQGATIETYMKTTGVWHVTRNPLWDKNRQYRVKPQPKVTKVYMHYDGIEELVQSGRFNYQDPQNLLYDNNYKMSNHLEMTFEDGKLTKVEMKGTTY